MIVHALYTIGFTIILEPTVLCYVLQLHRSKVLLLLYQRLLLLLLYSQLIVSI